LVLKYFHRAGCQLAVDLLCFAQLFQSLKKQLWQ
jgi:hypothetical protein